MTLDPKAADLQRARDCGLVLNAGNDLLDSAPDSQDEWPAEAALRAMPSDQLIEEVRRTFLWHNWRAGDQPRPSGTIYPLALIRDELLRRVNTSEQLRFVGLYCGHKLFVDGAAPEREIDQLGKLMVMAINGSVLLSQAERWIADPDHHGADCKVTHGWSFTDCDCGAAELCRRLRDAVAQ